MTFELTHPADALTFLRKDFPRATADFERGRDGKICGWWFRINKRSKQFCVLGENGGVNLFTVRLFRDGQVYARDRAKVKRELRALRGAAL